MVNAMWWLVLVVNMFKIPNYISHFQPELGEKTPTPTPHPNFPQVPQNLQPSCYSITFVKVPVKIPSFPTTIKVLP